METSVWGGGGTRCGVGEGTVTTHPSSLPPGTDPAPSMSSQGSSWRGPSPSLADTSPPLGMGHFGRPPGSATQPCSGTTSVPPGGPSLLWSHSTLHRGQHASPRREIRHPPATLPCPPLPRFGQPCQASPAPGYPTPCARGWGCLPCTLLLPGRSFLLPPPRIPLPPSPFSVSLISANGKWAPSLLGKLPGGCRPGTGYKLSLESLRGGGG